MRRLHLRPQPLELLVHSGQHFAELRFLERHGGSTSASAAMISAASSADFRSSSMLSASRRARSMPRRSISARQLIAPARRLPPSCASSARQRSPLGAMPFFQTRQFDAQRRVFFADSRGVGFELLHLLALRRPAPAPARRAVLPFRPPPRDSARAARGSARFSRLQPFQFEPRHRNPRVGARRSPR